MSLSKFKWGDEWHPTEDAFILDNENLPVKYRAYLIGRTLKAVEFRLVKLRRENETNKTTLADIN